MLVRIKDMDLFVKGNRFILYDEIVDTYEVLAIISQKKEISYLVHFHGIPQLYKEKYFEIIDDRIPDYWIFKPFKYNNLLKNIRFDIIMDLYIGPKGLIEDSDFFFDVIDEPAKANQTLYDTLKIYGKEWKTPPQT